jgi:ABC-type dipeptide/oligopeptide/nickel transport system permease component
VTAQEATGLVGALGFPIVLVAGLLWFFAVKVWPWYVARQAANDAAAAHRGEAYNAEIAQTRQVYERFIAALDRLIVKMDVQHAEVIHELRSLKAKPHLESDRDR